MKKIGNRALSMLMALVMCLGLLPAPALAEESGGGSSWPSVTISGTPTLNGGGSPSLTMSWTYGGALPSTSFVVEVYAWVGSNTTRPDSGWLMTSADNTATSFSGNLAPYGASSPDKLSGACMVQVALEDYESNVLTASPAVPVTAIAPTPPTISKVEYYNNYGGFTGSWYLYSGGSDNFAAYTLTQVASEAEAKNESLSWAGQQVDGKWYKAIDERSVDPDNDIIDKGDGTKALTARAESYTPTPDEQIWLAIWDYGAEALSNVVGITVPKEGEKSAAEPKPTMPESGTQEWKDALTPVVDSVEILNYAPSEATGMLQVGVTFHFPNLPTGGKIEDLPGFNGMHVVTNATHPANGNTAQVAPGNARLSSDPVESVSAISNYWDWAYLSDGKGYAVKTFDLEPEAYLVWGSSGDVNGIAVGDTLNVSMTANGIIRDSSGAYVDSYGSPNSASVRFTVADGIAHKIFTPSSAPSPTITTASLPEATIGERYSTTLSGTPTATGASLVWSEDSGSQLSAAGLTLSQSGVISGTPTNSGDFRVSVILKENTTGTDAATRTFTLKVKGRGPTINVSSPLPNANAGKPYTVPLKGEAKSGGTLTWSLQSGSSLPDGLSLTKTTGEGEISGTPTTEGTFAFTVVLTETGNSETSTQQLSLTVDKADAPTITTASLPEATTGLAYSCTLAGTAANGGTLHWSLKSGTLPASLTLTDAGVLSGTPAESGTSTITLTLTERWSAGGSEFTAEAEKAFSLAVRDPAQPEVTTTTLTDAREGEAYSFTLQGKANRGGTLAWAVEGLPEGLSCDESSGAITGTVPVNKLEYPFTADLTVTLTETAETLAVQTTKQLKLSVLERDKFKISFYLNGGAPAEGTEEGIYNELSLKKDEELTLPAAPVRQGYDFNGWSWSGTTYEPGAKLTVTARMSFSAQWTAKPPVSVSYSGKVVGSVSLRGSYDSGSGEQNVSLWSDYYYEPTVPEGMNVSSYHQRYYNVSSLELWAYVDGETTPIASGDFSEGGITLSPTGDFWPVTGAEAVGLAEGDYNNVSSVYSSNYKSNLYFPFMIRGSDVTGQGVTYSTQLSGVSSSAKYEQYDWTKSYNAVYVTSGDTAILQVTPDPLSPNVTVSGHVYFGTGQTGIYGATVTVTQSYKGMYRNLTATTDGNGLFSLTCYNTHGADGGRDYKISVTWGDRDVYYQYDPTLSENMEIHVNSVRVGMNLKLDIGSLAQETFSSLHTNTGIDRGLLEIFGRDSSGSERRFDWRKPTVPYEFHTTLYNLSDLNSASYRVTGDYLETASGALTFRDGLAEVDVTVKLRAAVTASLSATVSGNYSLAWFKGGTYVGSTYCGLSGTPRLTLSVCPEDSGDGTFSGGSYTLVLMPQSYAGSLTPGETALSALEADMSMNRWSVSLEKNQVAELSAFTVTSEMTENSRYITKPNSSAAADRDSFVSTSDLVRITGTVGLDAGLTDGKLHGLSISSDVSSNTDGHDVPTANIRYIVIGGERYEREVTHANGGKLTLGHGTYTLRLPLEQPVDLPCTFTIYCNPETTDWDINLGIYTTMYGGLSYRRESGQRETSTYSSQLIDNVTVKRPGSSITVLSQHVCSDTVSVSGAVGRNEGVTIYDCGIPVGSAQADRKGLWSTKVPLAYTDPQYTTTHLLTAESESGVLSDDLYVFHDPNGPELTRLTMAYNPWGGAYGKELDVGDRYTYNGMREPRFRATFRNPDALETVIAWDESAQEQAEGKVIFKYYLNNGTIGFLVADSYETNDDGTGVYSAILSNGGKYLGGYVEAVECLFQPKDALAAGNNPFTQSEDGNTIAYTMTELDEQTYAQYADGVMTDLNAAFAEVNPEEDSFTISFSDDRAAFLSGTDPLGAEGGLLESAQAMYDNAKAAGAEFRSYSMDYHDDTTLLQWINETADAWVASNPAAGRTDVAYAIATQYAYYPDAAQYQSELAALAGAAQYHVHAEGLNGTLVNDQYTFSDADMDGDEPSGGTFTLVVNASADSVRELWMTGVTLCVTPKFTGFGGLVPAYSAVESAAWRNWEYRARLLSAGGQGGGGSKFNPNTYKANAGSVLLQTVGALVTETGSQAGDTSAYTGTMSATLDLLRKSPWFSDILRTLKNMSDAELDNLVFDIGFTSGAMAGINQAISMYDYLGANDDPSAMQADVKRWFSSPCWIKMIREYRKLASQELHRMVYANGHWFDTGPANPDRDPYLIRMEELQKKLRNYENLMKTYQTWNSAGFWVNTGGNGLAMYGMLSPQQLAALGTKAVAAKVALPVGAAVFCFGKFNGMNLEILGSKAALLYNDLGQNFVECIDIFAKRLNDKDCLGLRESMTLPPDAPKTFKVVHDPAGTVFEAVIENPVEGALVTLYRNDSGALVQAEDVEDLVPEESTQTTGADGKYSWGVPEGGWFVTAQHAGYLDFEDDASRKSGSSHNDKAATGGTATLGGTAYNLLPVLPPQLDVNIPLVDDAVPYVSDAQYTTDGVLVTFSKYMMDSSETGANAAYSVLDPVHYTVTVNGTPLEAGSFTLTAMEQGHVPDNLVGEDGTHTYTRTVLIGITGLQEGDNVSWTLKGTVHSYAGQPLGADNSVYSAGGDVGTVTLDTPVMTVAQDGGATATLSASGSQYITRGGEAALALPENAPANTKLYYTLNGGEKTLYTAPITVDNNTVVEFWAELGLQQSEHITANLWCDMQSFLVAGTVQTADGSTADGVTVTLRGGNYSASTTVDDGGFLFMQVEPGTYTLTLSGGGYQTVTRTVAVDGGDVTLTVTLTKSSYDPGDNGGGSDYTGGGGSSSSSNNSISIPFSGDANTVSLSGTVNGTAVSLTKPTDAQLERVLGEGVRTGTVGIDLSGLNRDITAVSIPIETFAAIEAAVRDPDNDASGLKLRLTDGSATFDAKALAAIAAQAESRDLYFKLDRIAGTRLNAAQRAAAEDMDVLAFYEAYLTSDGKRIRDFRGGSAVVAVPCALQDGRTAAGLTAWYLAEDGGTEEVPAVYSGGEAAFTAPHLSHYALAYDETRAAQQEAASVSDCPRDASCPIAAFTDTDPALWYHDGIHYAIQQGIMNGTGDATFEPDRSASRAMIVTMLWRMEGEPVVNYVMTYADVPEGQWYTEAVRWASSEGIVGGFDDLTFGPNYSVTREQLATILYRCAVRRGQGFQGAWMFLLQNPDAASVSDWADEAMHWMVLHGIINGMEDGRLDPGGNATRAQVATMLLRYGNEISGESV